MADYRKCNPKIAVGIVDGKPDPLGVEFPIYNEDGSSNPIVMPTAEQLFDMAKTLFQAMPDKDIRMVYHLLTEMVETVESLITNTLSSHLIITSSMPTHLKVWTKMCCMQV